MQRFVAGLLGAVVRVAGWLLMAVVALALLGLALLLLAVGAVWALLRGRRPEPPVFVAQFQRYAAGRMWPGAGRPGAGSADVVDAEVREVRDVHEAPERAGAADGAAGAAGAETPRLDARPDGRAHRPD